MPATHTPRWGPRSVTLELPTGCVRFTGLSGAQAAALTTSYSRFIRSDARPGAGTVQCRVFQLAQPLQIDARELTVDGLYTPLHRRSRNAIDVTGINFQARIPAQAARGDARLGVALEHELAQPNVVENFLRILAAHRGLALGGAVLHSAGLVLGGRAYIFAGRSGAGKTTLTRKAHSRGATVLSDDINLVLPHADGYRAYAVPFTGEFGRTLDHASGLCCYPVAALILLEQARQLAAKRLGPATAVARLLVSCPFVNTDAQATGTLFDNLARLVAGVPVIRLQNRAADSVSDIMTTVRDTISDA